MPVKLNSAGGGSVTMDVGSTASNFTVTIPSATGTMALTSQVAGTGYGDIGSYVIAATTIFTANTELLPNSTVAGSSLIRSTVTGDPMGINTAVGNTSLTSAASTSLGLSGTWRRMTRSYIGSASTSVGVDLYVRIS